MTKFTIFGTTAPPTTEIGRMTQGLGLGEDNRGLVPIDLSSGGGGGGGGLLQVQTISSLVGVPFIPHPLMVNCLVQLRGGGGGGGGAPDSNYSVGFGIGGGGGQGELSEKLFTRAEIENAIITCGAGGLGGDGETGENGTASTVGALLTADFGRAGSYSSSPIGSLNVGAVAEAGAGGGGSTNGDRHSAGTAGTNGFAVSGTPGAASGGLGGGANGRGSIIRNSGALSAGNPGSNAGPWGGGGGGGTSWGTGVDSDVFGGNGSQGVCYVIEFG